jgi:hypothetical protein
VDWDGGDTGKTGRGLGDEDVLGSVEEESRAVTVRKKRN